MSAKFEFTAQTRTERGKSAARRLRCDKGMIPAIVYGAGKEPQAISLLHKDIFHALENEAVFSHILKLSVDGVEEQVVIKDIQRHAYKLKIVHVDFLRVKAKEKITMNVPLHFEGEEQAPGVKEGDGTFTKNITDVEIRCLPANLPEFIAVDVSGMQIDDTLHLSDIQLPPHVELTQLDLSAEQDHPVISCHIPKVTQEAEITEEVAATDSSTETDLAEEASKLQEGEGDKKAKDGQ